MRDTFIILLCALPFVVIGFVSGMLITRWIYLPTVRWQRKRIEKLERAYTVQKNKMYFAPKISGR